MPSGRPRVTRTGHVYKPAKSRIYEGTGAIQAANQYRQQGGTNPIGGPVSLTVNEYRRIPPSWSKGKRDDASLGLIKPTGRPDIDNTVKAAMDILTKAGIWGDDAQVISLSANKLYGNPPRLEIDVYEDDAR